MSHIVDTEPSSHGEVTGQQVWQDAMAEEYHSVLKNDAWDIVPRPEGKSVVTSKWIYKIKHAADGREIQREICSQRILTGGGN